LFKSRLASAAKTVLPRVKLNRSGTTAEVPQSGQKIMASPRKATLFSDRGETMREESMLEAKHEQTNQ
jgi:hypothetical protein